MNDPVTALTSKSANPWKDPLGRMGSRSAQLLLVIGLVGIVVFALTRVSLVVIPLIVALILATAIAPVVKWFMAKGMPSLWATMLAFLSILLVTGGVFTGIAFAIRSEWPELVRASTESFNQFWNFLKTGPFHVDDRMIADAQKFATDFLTSSSFGSGALSGVGAAGSFFAGLGIVVVSLFFFLKDGAQMWSFFLGFIPDNRKEKTSLAGDKVIAVLGGYVRGTATIAAIDALIIWAALALLHVPLALPLAVLTFIGGFIPIVGATAANIFALLITLVFTDPISALIVLAVIIVSGQLEGNILQPILMGNALKIHGLTIIVALTVGTILAGVVGAILSVPIVAAGWAVVKIFRDSEALVPPELKGPEPTKPEAADSEETADSASSTEGSASSTENTAASAKGKTVGIGEGSAFEVDPAAITESEQSDKLLESVPAAADRMIPEWRAKIVEGKEAFLLESKKAPETEKKRGRRSK